MVSISQPLLCFVFVHPKHLRPRLVCNCSNYLHYLLLYRPTHVVETDLSSWSHIIGWAYFITVRWVASLGVVADNQCVRGLGICIYRSVRPSCRVFVSLSTLYTQHATRFRLETRLCFYCHALMSLSQATSTTAHQILLQLLTLLAAIPTHMEETDLSSWSYIIGWAYFIMVRWVASSGAVANNQCVRRLGAVSGLHVVFVSLYMYIQAMPHGSVRLLID